jgi:mono/diheme cytochrome c family protein
LIAEGEQLYNIACKTCHGIEAYGTRMAPSLNNQTFLSETPDAAIYQIIAGGVPETVMPAWGNRLTEEDLSALVAYLRSLEATAPPIANP